MPIITLKIKVYSVDEARERLAELKKRKKPYERGSFYKIIRDHKPEFQKALITEADLEELAKCIKKPGRPRKTIDKSE